jgi:hypothetical protein
MLKHDYFIEDLGQPAGWFKARRHRYSCLRCRWAFIVEDRGKISALNGNGEALAEPLNSERVATFVDGPCIPVTLGTAARPQNAINKAVVIRLGSASRRRSGGVGHLASSK